MATKTVIRLIASVLTTAFLCVHTLSPVLATDRETLAPPSEFKLSTLYGDARDIPRYYDRTVYFFSTATNTEDRMHLMIELMEKTKIVRGTLRSPLGPNYRNIVFTAAYLALLSVVIAAIQSGNVFRIFFFGGFSCVMAIVALLWALLPYWETGAFVPDDIFRLRVRKLLKMIYTRNPEMMHAGAVTYVRFLPDGTRRLEKVLIEEGSRNMGKDIVHEGIHAVAATNQLNVGAPENEYILANAISAFADFGLRYDMLFSGLVEERPGIKKIGREQGIALYKEVTDLMHPDTLSDSEDTFHTLGAIDERLRDFSRTYAQHLRALNSDGVTQKTEHILPIAMRAQVWGAIALKLANATGSRLAGFLFLAKMAAGPYPALDGHIRASRDEAFIEAQDIIATYEKRARDISPYWKRRVMGFVREGFLHEADVLLVFGPKRLGRATPALDEAL